MPKLTVYFWIVKLLTTAIGEAISDYLVNRFNPVPVVIVAFVGLAAVLWKQLHTDRYVTRLLGEEAKQKRRESTVAHGCFFQAGGGVNVPTN